jgi:tetratricopeptide (TPR) repeat protein
MRLLIIPVLIFAGLSYGWSQQLSAQELFDLGRQEHSSGNYEVAVSLFTQCLAKSPSHTEAYAARASSRAELKDLAGALTDYSITLEQLPQHFEARLGRANVFYKLKRYAEARDDYEKLLNVDAGETSSIYFQKSASASGTMQITSAQSGIHPMVFNQLGLSEYQLGNYHEALVWLDSAIRLNPREADYYVNRGLVREKLGDKNASEDIHKALQINPQHTAALSALGSSGAGSTERKNYLDEAIRSDSTAVYPYLERGYQHLQDGSYREALSDFDAALALEPGNPDIWLNRGYVREKLNDLPGAYSDFTKAILLKEDYPKAWLNRGNVLKKQGRLSEALEDYTVALTYDPAYGSAYYNRAILRAQLKQNAEACDDVRKAKQLGVSVDEKLRKAVCE